MTTEEELKDAVNRFQVCWESFPELSVTNHERRQVGFVVELYGTHNLSNVVPTAGCKHCIPVMQALLAIADFAVPDAWRENLDVLRAQSGIEYANERGGRPDIVVAITMIPRHPGESDGDAATRCLADIRARLQQLGVCERSWRNTRRPAIDSAR